MIDSAGLAYPILCLSSRGGVWSEPSCADLNRTTKHTLDTGFYAGMRIIDSQLDLYDVAEVVLVRYRPPFRGWRLPSFDREIDTAIGLKPCRRLTLAQAKDIVCETMLKAADVWDSGADDIDTILARLRSLDSFADLVSLQWSKALLMK